MVFDSDSTKSTSFPSSRSVWNAMNGYLRDDGPNVVERDLVEPHLPRGRLLRLRRVGAEALDERLQVLDLVFLAAIGLLLEAEGELTRLVPERVVAGEERDLLEVDVRHVRAHAVEEVAIVGDDDHRVLEAQQELLEPEDRVDVEVVRRLVEQEDLRLAEQRLRQQHAHLLAVLEVADELPLAVLPEPEGVEQRPGLGLGIPAVEIRRTRSRARPRGCRPRR